MAAAPDHTIAPHVRELRTPFSIPLLYGKGIAMGLGDSVPGVSGGTIAVITNIYERLIFAIKAVDLVACKLLLRGRLTELWRHVDGNFLLVLVLGILSGLLLSANMVLFLLANHFEPLMAFFSGLVLASATLLRHEFDYRHWRSLSAVVLGVGMASLVGMVGPQVAELSLLYLFFSGMIAICAMILPGLSGAFLLLLLGVYQFILTALVQLNVPYILAFTAGCGVGLLAFSRVLAWMLLYHHQISYGFITGILLGSVSLLWPWQQTVSSYVDSGGEEHILQSVNVWPLNYTAATGNDPLLLAAALSFTGGVGVVFLLRWVFAGKEESDS